MQEGSRRAVLVAFLANVGVAVAKFVGYAFTGAASLLAEAVHSAADSGNQVLLFVGAVRSEQPPSEEHQFGYGRERYFWAFVVAVVLFTLGSLFALNEGISKLRHPHEISSPEWAIGILLIAVVLEGFALRTAVVEARKLKGNESWWAFIRHAKVAALPVILLEDLGALVGLMVALVCVALTAWTGNVTFDAIGSLVIGVLLGVIAVVMGYEMKSLLIGEAASPRVQSSIRSVIEGHPRVHRFIQMRTQHLGPNEVLVGAKVELDQTLTLAEATTVLEDLEDRIREREPAASMIYIEPEGPDKEPR